MTMRAILVLLLAASGCATGYHPDGFSGGYSERQVNERAWEVYFRGNGWTSPGTAREYALRRAAELAIQTGHDGFVIAGEGATSSLYVTETTIAEKPEARLTVTMVRKGEPAPGLIHDARMILTSR